ncbi:YhhN-like protein [Chaetomium fimeti]|uniref:YhhN-like protein n=1 Tax=Chaetomium fimeti TaxID=1854472 RepID=A0AAE0HK92_9PEZI|nr:YhhN-like protein [Chaetomium fimeti]
MSSLRVPFTADSTVLACSIGASIVYLTMVRSPPSGLRMIVKTASTALLSALVFIQGGPLLLAGALALGSVGDAFLAWDDDTSFLYGLANFLVAHIFYIVLFFGRDTDRSVLFQSLLGSWRAVAAGLLSLLVPVMIALLMPRLDTALRLPVVLYSFTIFVMVLTALTSNSGQVISGSLMFSTSDAILAADRFLVPSPSTHRAWMQHAVWVLYYSGQLLIALGVLVPGTVL